MLAALGLTVSLVVVGETLVQVLNVPVPGAIFGLSFLALWFTWCGQIDAGLARMFDAIIPCAPVLFVPAGAAVMANFDVISVGGWAFVSAITVGTIATMVATGMIMQALLRALRSKGTA